MPLKNKDMLDLEQITKKVREIALQGGAFLRNERSSFDRGRVEKKNAHDYVSYVDKESEHRRFLQISAFVTMKKILKTLKSGTSLLQKIPAMP